LNSQQLSMLSFMRMPCKGLSPGPCPLGGGARGPPRPRRGGAHSGGARWRGARTCALRRSGGHPGRSRRGAGRGSGARNAPAHRAPGGQPACGPLVGSGALHASWGPPGARRTGPRGGAAARARVPAGGGRRLPGRSAHGRGLPSPAVGRGGGCGAAGCDAQRAPGLSASPACWRASGAGRPPSSWRPTLQPNGGAPRAARSTQHGVWPSTAGPWQSRWVSQCSGSTLLERQGVDPLMIPSHRILPLGPWVIARGFGPSCRRDGRAPHLAPSDPRTAPRGPTRAPWPHRAQAIASRSAQGRPLGAAPS
jgi:hypothetical protein